MTFKWPGTPSARAGAHELADFAELTAWREGGVSALGLLRRLGRIGENDHSEGVAEDEEAEPAVEETCEELERRGRACGAVGGYPFEMDAAGNTLQVAGRDRSPGRDVYRYLLLATRLDMGRDREHAGIDGTLLFEKLSAEIAQAYLGDRAESLVFGTAAGGADFPGKVDDLCRRIGEGGGFARRARVSPERRDGKLDVVAWKPFSDGMEGKLIAFGQCKTGTGYKRSLAQLQPDSFCGKWMRSIPVLNPVRMFFVSESLSRRDWAGDGLDGGLVFDRCRIVDFCGGASGAVLDELAAWTEAAAGAAGLSGG